MSHKQWRAEQLGASEIEKLLLYVCDYRWKEVNIVWLLTGARDEVISRADL